MPRILRDLLADILSAEPGMELVDGSDALLDPTSDALARTETDVLIVGLEVDELPLICAELIGRLPRVKLLALKGMGREICLYELRPTRTRLGPMSPTDLVALIRRAKEPMPLATRAIVGSGAGAPGAEDTSLMVTLSRERTR